MEFSLLTSRSQVPSAVRNQAYLVADNWNDYNYQTSFELIIADQAGQIVDIGGVKIATMNASAAPYSTLQDGLLPNRFTELDDRFFSLGQSREYYDALNAMSATLRRQVLTSLRDIAFNDQLFRDVEHLEITRTSLLRSVPEFTVVKQFRRIARGGDKLVSFWFNYSRPRQQLNLEFKVEHDSTPPSNIHVLIGQNGAGKTRILRGMTQAFKERNSLSHYQRLNSESGAFHTEAQQSDVFANMVTVSFSAFDSLDPLQQGEASQLDCIHVGLITEDGNASGGLRPKTPAELNGEFVSSFLTCAQEPARSRWSRAINVLTSDPNFHDSGIARIFDDGIHIEPEITSSEGTSELDLGRRAEYTYRELSSGHRAVLLTITKLVENVQERTLVLLDEPESHLHPPLLSAFVRALSDLLVERNGVAIIATHSPVVLQEVPRECVWKIWRAGYLTQRERPVIETFGEGVGLLTHEVFGLEVTRSGFHALLAEYVDQGLSYRDIVDRFDGRIGQEARAILQGLVSARETE